MKNCQVSIQGGAETHQVDVRGASSLFDAVDQAIALGGWAKLWWWSPTAVIEVHVGEAALARESKPGYRLAWWPASFTQLGA